MPQNIFGTDGVRGVANADLSCDLAFRLGRAATKFLGPDICVGRDTRLSGTMLESALTAGIMAEGGRPHCCGVIPTPAVALLTVQNDLDGGIVISASHNPPEFNGIKFFSRKGMKLPDAVEEEISAWVMSEEAMAADTLPTGAGVGHIIKMKDARKAYVDHAISTLDGLKLDGLVVAVDCGHGASCQTTPAALQRLGATVHAINTDYCGTDINVECGSTHLEPLRELVLRTHADIGLAHDGDADRVLFVDSEGNEIDGDYILAICGSDLAARGKLANSEIVSTVMCNLGFSIAMKEQGFEMVQTAVGDRYVLERMLADGAVIGGEQSGHIIFLEHNTTGDGLVTALQLLEFFGDFYDDFDRDAAVQMMQRLGIQPKQQIKQMSKGTREKVQLILVMSRKAKLYLLDEPIGGVDPATRDFILNTIISNYNPEAAVVISTHLIADVENILDDVAFLSRGHLLLQSSADELRAKEGKSVDAVFREVFRC